MARELRRTVRSQGTGNGEGVAVAVRCYRVAFDLEARWWKHERGDLRGVVITPLLPQ